MPAVYLVASLRHGPGGAGGCLRRRFDGVVSYLIDLAVHGGCGNSTYEREANNVQDRMRAIWAVG